MSNDVFDEALRSLKSQDYKAAIRLFKEVFDATDEHNDRYNRFASYLGLAQTLDSDLNGLLLCRDAASSEVVDGDVFLNLACAELVSQNRKRAVDAIFRGCKIDSEHKRLQRACNIIDGRKKSIIPFLPRHHPLNRKLGRLMRRSRGELNINTLLY